MIKIVIPVFPGTNCEVETQRWIADNLNVDAVLVNHKQHFDNASAVVIPGGFSYGDYLRTGALAARSKCMQSVIRSAAQGVPVLGICNGFQILCEAKLLPGCLVQNISGRHQHEIVSVSLTNNQVKSPWIPNRPLTKLQLPISCGFGCYLSDPKVAEGSVLLRYKTSELVSELGSDVAAISVGNVMGMMPHPERASDPILGGTDGLLFLLGLSESLKIGIRPQSPLDTFQREISEHG